MEYDGLARLDWRLRPRRAATVERLVVELPFRGNVARLLSTWPRTAPGALGEAYASPFQPLVWLGDEERGLQWVCESERNWSVADAERALEIVRQGDTTVLRLNLVTRPVRVEAGGVLDYTFGLQASPVKPLVQDAWDARIVRATKWYGKELELPDQKVGDKPALEYYAEKGARVIMVWWWWDAFAYPLPLGHEERFRRLVRECHRVGLKVIPYVGGFLMSELAPEAPFFRDEMRVRPMPPYRSTHSAKSGSLPMPGWQPQFSLFACQRGPWQDFIVDGIARLIDEYDVDGVYLDTTTVPFACGNDLHGCGYRDADGQAKPAYPVFSVRDNLRRIYTTVKQRKPDGIVDLHIYDCMNLPAMTWATTYWHGEALHGLTPDKVPLDLFRTEFLGANLGVPADLLYYVLKNYPKSVALALLHDVPVRPEQLPDLDRISQLWRVRDEFGVKQARWLPYWSNRDVVKVGPTNCYASLFAHPDGRVLAYVSNLGKEAAEIRLALDLTKLGLNGDVRAKNALSGAPVDVNGGVIGMNLPSQDYRVLWIGE